MTLEELRAYYQQNPLAFDYRNDIPTSDNSFMTSGYVPQGGGALPDFMQQAGYTGNVNAVGNQVQFGNPLNVDGMGQMYSGQLNQQGQLDPSSMQYAEAPWEQGEDAWAPLAPLFPIAAWAGGLGAGAAAGSGGGAAAGGMTASELAMADMALGGVGGTGGATGLSSAMSGGLYTGANALGGAADAAWGVNPQGMEYDAFDLGGNMSGGAGDMNAFDLGGNMTGGAGDMSAVDLGGNMSAAPTTSSGFSGSSLVPGVSNSALSQVVGGVAGAVQTALAPDSETTTSQRTLDPRLEAALWGPNGGVFNRLQQFADAPPSAGVQSAFNTADQYLQNTAPQDLAAMRSGIMGQMNSNIQAPSMTAQSAGPAQAMTAQSAGPAAQFSAGTTGPAAQAGFNQAGLAQSAGYTPAGSQGYSAAQVNQSGIPGASYGTSQAQQAQAANINAPGQNNLGLNPAFNDMIYGQAGNNPYLTGAIQRGLDQSGYNMQNRMTDMTNQFQRDIMGNIRRGAVAAGGYGDSRQGVAEGIAAEGVGREMSRMLAQYGMDANSAAVQAQAGAYDTDRNRAANAMGQLSGSQYGNAQSQAGFQNQANLTNAQLGTQAGIANAGNQTQAGVAGQRTAADIAMANAGATNQASQFGANAANTASLQNAQTGAQVGMFNTGQANNMNQFNAGQANQTGQFNAGQTNQTNQFNTGQQNQVGMYNTGQQNNMAQFDTGQANQASQFNTGQANQQNQFNTGQANTVGANNMQAQLSTNNLNSSNINSGIGNAWTGFTGMTNLANQGNLYGQNQYLTNLNAATPLFNYFTGQQNTAPLYNNPVGNILGGATVGAQLYNLL